MYIVLVALHPDIEAIQSQRVIETLKIALHKVVLKITDCLMFSSSSLRFRPGTPPTPPVLYRVRRTGQWTGDLGDAGTPSLQNGQGWRLFLFVVLSALGGNGCFPSLVFFSSCFPSVVVVLAGDVTERDISLLLSLQKEGKPRKSL